MSDYDLHVSDEEYAEWERERIARADYDRERNAWKHELQCIPGDWRGPGAERELAKKLRGELVAQEVVARLVGEINLLRWYIDVLEDRLVEQGRLASEIVGADMSPWMEPGDVLLRRMAMGTVAVPAWDASRQLRDMREFTPNREAA